jgi:hypothetical protein
MKSFLQGKRTVEMTSLRNPQSSVALVAGMSCHAQDAAAAALAGAAPQIEVVRQGDKIMRIIVTCTCGERTEIECLYSPGQ